MAYSVSPNLLPKTLPRGNKATETSSHSSSTLVESSDSPSHSESSSSDSESDEDDSDSSDGDAEEEEDENSRMLEQLLIKAKESAKQKEIDQKANKESGNGDGLAGNEEMVFFGDEDEESDGDDAENEGGTPKASTSKPISLPPSLVRPLSLAPPTSTSSASLLKGKSRAGPISLSQDLSGIMTSSTSRPSATGVTNDSQGRGEKWGMAPVPRLSKKAYKATQPHTAGSKWFDMPATPMTPELKREIDAMRLRNSLDPKKFMKGGAKNEKIGEFFQVGHVITPNTRATTSNSLPTASKRSFVEELVEDEQARAYAKKKTKEVMQRGMSGRKRQRKGTKGSYAMGMGGGKDGAGLSGGNKRKR
ncbi:hypothetical protein JCM16303_003022 [Sporobolomyces ruberrimus]